MNRFCLAICLALILSLVGAATAADPVAKSGSEFDRLVAPFLKRHCAKCHGEEKPKADLRLYGIQSDFTTDAKVDTWQNVLEQLELGEMPPEKEPRPNAKDLGRVVRWISAELKKVNQEPAIKGKQRSPEYGNYLNHEQLFDGSHQGPASSPPRLWRLGPRAYEQIVDNLGGQLRRVTAIHQPFPVDETKGVIADFAAQHFADAATVQLLMMNCETIAKYQTTGIIRRSRDGRTRRVSNTPREFQPILESDDAPTKAQIEAALSVEFNFLLSRRPTDAELTQFVDFFQRARRQGGNVRGLQTTLMAIMMKPEGVYRMEMGLGPEDEHGRRKLSPYELAFALAYALTDKGPSRIRIKAATEADAEGENEPAEQSLLDLARAGKLSTPRDIRRVVRRFLDDNSMADADFTMFAENHRIGNTQVLRFFREFFGYHHAPKVFKDEKRIGAGDEFHTRRLVQDADQLVMHIFDQDKDVLRRLLTTDEYFVAYPGSLEKINKDLRYIKRNVDDQNFRFNKAYVQRAEAAGRHPIPIEGPSTRRYVQFYNLDHETWDYPTEQPFKLANRAGILTHPAWLVAWSGNFENDPIRRGKWIREHLLADTIPNVPITVNAVVPEEPHKSLRQRLEVTREEYCWKCHQKMNPLGLPFESFDDFGRRRTREMIGELLTIFPRRHRNAKTLPIDTTGEITDSGDDKLDGKIGTEFELMHKLAGSTRVRQSFVRHAFRFWMGRNETFGDSPTLIAADKAYLDNGGSMKALLASLLSSDSFLYRKEPGITK